MRWRYRYANEIDCPLAQPIWLTPILNLWSCNGRSVLSGILAYGWTTQRWHQFAVDVNNRINMDWLFTIGQEVFGALHPTAIWGSVSWRLALSNLLLWLHGVLYTTTAGERDSTCTPDFVWHLVPPDRLQCLPSRSWGRATATPPKPVALIVSRPCKVLVWMQLLVDNEVANSPASIHWLSMWTVHLFYLVLTRYMLFSFLSWSSHSITVKSKFLISNEMWPSALFYGCMYFNFVPMHATKFLCFF
jgi:hypothetical protein